MRRHQEKKALTSCWRRCWVRIAANVATAGFLLAAFLQLLLALGVIPITTAWGGTQSTLTLPLRVASLIAAAIQVMAAFAIRRRAGLWGAQPRLAARLCDRLGHYCLHGRQHGCQHSLVQSWRDFPFRPASLAASRVMSACRSLRQPWADFAAFSTRRIVERKTMTQLMHSAHQRG
jgi:hypothetical protein